MKPTVKMVIGFAMVLALPLWLPLVLIAALAWILGEAAQCAGESVGILERTPEPAFEEEA